MSPIRIKWCLTIERLYCERPPRKNVVVQGVDNLIIAEKDNYLMICHRKDEDKIKRFEKFFRHKK